MTDDTISRAAALNIAHTLIIPGEEFHQNNQAIGNYTAELVKLPSAQSVAKDINVPVKDCISRAAAIETVRKAKSIGQAHRMLVQLTSAQPETAKRIVGKAKDGMTLWYQCDMCNEPVDAQDAFCRGCGRRLTDG